MSSRKGTISVNTSDILPIIKKWLYSEHDIFLRELVSNSCDAITKRATLGRIKNVEIPEGKVTIEVNSKDKKIMIKDNGIGMTEEEVEKYIARLAFSGAQEFVDKMKSEGADSKTDIIGKFGLGFYSIFMVANKVEVDSLSFEEGAKPVKWISEGDTEYSFEESDRKEVGTTITAYLNDDSHEFAEKYKISSILRKYCDFMPYGIWVEDKADDAKKYDDYLKRKEEAEKKGEAFSEEAPKPEMVNSVDPLWKKDPTTLTDDDYLNFYRSQFPMDPDPLFWIHLKIDHPFELLGILYFPKININKPILDQNIRLYSKQVFVSDNVKDIIPEFLRLLKGHIDSSDIPLNVSRSSLQGDPNIKKISNYIIKKVGESLKKLFNNDRKKYESIWDDAGIFVKYGAVSDFKFDETMRPYVLLKTDQGKYLTFEEYQKEIPSEFADKLKNTVLYYEKDKADSFLMSQIKEAKIPAVETENIIDPHFIQHVEMHSLENKEKISFKLVSSEIENLLAKEAAEEDLNKIKDLFSKILSPKEEEENKEENKEASPFNNGNSNVEIEVKSYSNGESPAYIKLDEQMKRFQHMTKSMGNMNSEFPIKKTLVVNAQNKLVQNAIKISGKEENKDLVENICRHIQDLAMISSEGIKTVEEKDAFINRSQRLVQDLTNFVV